MRSAPACNDGYWELSKALVSRPDREPETFDTFTLSTHLTRERVGTPWGRKLPSPSGSCRI